MKRPLSVVLRCAILAIALASARGQTARVVSPEVLPDGRVTFRLQAPNARNVVVRLVGAPEPKPMTKASDGVWNVTVGPLAPDLHSYFFEIDGARVADPLNREVKKWFSLSSVVEVAGTPPALFTQQPVPHGTVHRHFYSSKRRGGEATFLVYTPPGYDPRSATRYPVLVLLHGYGDDEAAWTEVGRVHFIADNLVAQQRARPAIIVMPNCHPVPIEGRYGTYAPRNLEAVEQELLGEILPAVDATYATIREPSGRAIIGQSMGGGQSLEIGLRHPDVFQWVGGLSASIVTSDLDALLARLRKGNGTEPRNLPRLLWFSCGRQDNLMARGEALHAWLNANDVPHTWHPVDGDHSWTVWRGNMAEFLPLLFR